MLRVPQLWIRVLALIGFASLLARPGFAQSDIFGGGASGAGTLEVRIMSALGDPLPGFAVVKLTALSGSFERTESTKEAARATFLGVPFGSYKLEVSAPGFDRGEEQADVLPGRRMQVFVTLYREGTRRPAAEMQPNAILSPKAQKELEQGLALMNSGDLAKAKPRFEKVLKMAPGNPEPHFLLAALAYRQGDVSAAESSVQKALSLDPKHTGANSLHARILLRKKDLEGAVRALEAALVEDPDNWENQHVLTATLVEMKQFEKALSHGQRALALANEKAPQIRVLVAYALIHLGRKEPALEQLNQFLAAYPDRPEAAVAKDMKMHIEAASAASLAPAAVKAPVSPAMAAPLPVVKETDWAPAEVDAVKPYVAPDVTCSLPEVMGGIAKRVSQLAENLQGISATEQVEFAELDSRGTAKGIQSKQFLYMVSVEKIREILSVQEYRDGRESNQDFPSHLVTRGLSALALAFHPLYAKDLDFRCDGLGQWKGKSVWHVFFRQREGLQSQLRYYRRTTQAPRIPLALKGHAWIDANNFQILRLETDLVAPIEEVQFEREHITVDYRPVAFRNGKLQLWLPESAEMFAKIAGKRYRQKHTFSKFTYFSVDTKQKIHDPKTPDEPNPPPPQ